MKKCKKAEVSAQLSRLSQRSQSFLHALDLPLFASKGIVFLVAALEMALIQKCHNNQTAFKLNKLKKT